MRLGECRRLFSLRAPAYITSAPGNRRSTGAAFVRQQTRSRQVASAKRKSPSARSYVLQSMPLTPPARDEAQKLPQLTTSRVLLTAPTLPRSGERSQHGAER